MNHVFSDVVSCSFFEASWGKIFSPSGSYIQDPAAARLIFVVVAALVAEGCR